MIVLIDGRVFSTRMTGIGTFAKDIVTSFIKYYPDIQLIILCPRQIHENYKQWVNDLSVPIRYCPLISDNIPTTFWYHLYTFYLSIKYQGDVYITPFTDYPLLWNSKVKHVLTVHDVVCKEFKETMEWKNRIMSKLLFNYSIKRAQNIWCNSEYTKSSVTKYFPEVIDKRVFVGDSACEDFKKIDISYSERNDFLSFFGVRGKFVLFVGSVEPRKNLTFLLKIAPILYKKTGIRTLIVGANHWGGTHTGYDKESTVFIKNFIKTDDLVKFYNLASCYVSTSLNEGFGMPQLEAMKCGCPVVSPNNSAMTEVVSGYGTLVDGWDENVWVDAIIEEIKKEHKPHTGEKYDWKHIIDNFIKFCES